MRPVKCVNEHFFDADKFPKCPQCGADMKGGYATGATAAPAPKQGLFGGKKKEENVAVKMGGATTGTFGIFGGKNKAKKAEQPVNPVPVVDNNKPMSNLDQIKSHTSTSMSEYAGVSSDKSFRDHMAGVSTPVAAPAAQVPVTQAPIAQTPAAPVQPAQAVRPPVQAAPVTPRPAAPVQTQPVATPVAAAAATVAVAAATQVQAPVAAPSPAKPSAPATSSLMDDIKKSSADNGGKTVGFFSAGKVASSQESAPVITDPVVGWLVCTKGVHFGESFPIYSGRNSVGRNSDNRICISRDNTISREKHCWIVFEPRKRKFFVQPGESSGLVYVNDDNIMTATEINDRGVLEIGNTSLMLVALCDGNFSWEDYQS